MSSRLVESDTPVNPSLIRFLALALLGLFLILGGLAWDAILHARDAGLAAEEGLFTLANPGHVGLAAGILATGIGVMGATIVVVRESAVGTRYVKATQVLVGTSIIALVGVFGWIVAGPGLDGGHHHSFDIVDSEVLAGRYTQIPPEEASALIELSLSRPGSIDADLAGHHGGHSHHGENTQAGVMTSEEAGRLDDQLARAADAAMDLRTVEQATAAGFSPSAPRAEGVGVHWTKWSWVDEPFDPEKPSQLLFEEVTFGAGPELVGLSYWVYSDHEPEGFAGSDDVWHQHLGLCFEDGIAVNEKVPDRTGCAGDWINGKDLWMLHVWVVPGMENRLGVFANINPRFCERFCE